MFSWTEWKTVSLSIVLLEHFFPNNNLFSSRWFHNCLIFWKNMSHLFQSFFGQTSCWKWFKPFFECFCLILGLFKGWQLSSNILWKLPNTIEVVQWERSISKISTVLNFETWISSSDFHFVYLFEIRYLWLLSFHYYFYIALKQLWRCGVSCRLIGQLICEYLSSDWLINTWLIPDCR